MKQKKNSCIKIIWAECNLVLRKVIQSPFNPNITSQSYENLEAEVQIEDQDIEQKFQPSLTFRQGFPYLQKKFHWSLRRPLPSLTITLQNCYLQKIKEDEEIIDLYSQISAAYVANKDDHFYLEEVKLIGNRIKKFDEKGNLEYSHIKFAHSSLKKENNKFCLIVTIFAQCIEEQRVIIKSYICSQIFVCPFLRMNSKKRQINQVQNCIIDNNCQVMETVQDKIEMQIECKQLT